MGGHLRSVYLPWAPLTDRCPQYSTRCHLGRGHFTLLCSCLGSDNLGPGWPEHGRCRRTGKHLDGRTCYECHLKSNYVGPTCPKQRWSHDERPECLHILSVCLEPTGHVIPPTCGGAPIMKRKHVSRNTCISTFHQGSRGSPRHTTATAAPSAPPAMCLTTHF